MEHAATEMPQKRFVRLAKKWRRPLGGAALAIFFLGGAFYGGVTYQKHQTPATTSNSAMRTASSFGQSGNGSSFGGRGAGFQRSGRVIGQVTAVSSSSITVQATSGASTTLAITSSTTITNDAQNTSASSIAVGDTVFVTESTSNTGQAARIMLNPSFGGQDMSQTNAQTQSD